MSSQGIPKQHRNHFLEAFSGDKRGKDEKATALIVLNNPSVLECKDLLDTVWEHCDVKICADGGANILYDIYAVKETDGITMDTEFLPDLIKGDLDSLNLDVREYYQSKGVSILEDRDENFNDLDKCMGSLMDYYVDKGKSKTVVIFGGFGGRIDQEMASYHALIKWDCYFHRIVLVGIPSVAFILSPGSHVIQTSLDDRKEGNHCGLFPMTGSATVTTKGLEWDMTHLDLNFGSFVSSSNHIPPESSEIIIETSNYLLWTSSLI